MKSTRILFLIALFAGQMLVSFADRGIGKKKNRVMLNIKVNNTFTSSLKFNLRNGMAYTGTIINRNPLVSTTTNSLITYQKGNSVYILPYKQKVLVADTRQGFAGTKLIIRVR